MIKTYGYTREKLPGLTHNVKQDIFHLLMEGVGASLIRNRLHKKYKLPVRVINHIYVSDPAIIEMLKVREKIRYMAIDNVERPELEYRLKSIYLKNTGGSR